MSVNVAWYVIDPSEYITYMAYIAFIVYINERECLPMQQRIPGYVFISAYM